MSYSHPQHEVADVFRKYGDAYRANHRVPATHLRVMQAITMCRTITLGGHAEQCGGCGHQRIAYNSCRNRHCPKCQFAAREQWVECRKAELLPVSYFHVVFTLPAQLNHLAMFNPRLIYTLLFRAAWLTVKTLADDPRWLGARAGMVAVLHTWGQNLSLHPHLHCIVPDGGLSHDEMEWIPGRQQGKFLFPVKVMSRLFRGKMLAFLKKAWKGEQINMPPDAPDMQQLIDELYRKEWVAYAKRPFGGPRQVINYLGRYTHRIAITNHRIKSIAGGKVCFSLKDYRDGKQKQSTLNACEFIRRFLQHVLPNGFHKIRYFGFMATCHRKELLPHIRSLFGLPTQQVPKTDSRTLIIRKTGMDPARCPVCRKGYMHILSFTPPVRGSPGKINQ